MSYRRSKRDRVLVVDDDASLAEMLSIVLEGEGLTTSIVRSGEQVMPEFASFKPDVVLLDLMLPGLDGMSVCRRIRARGYRVTPQVRVGPYRIDQLHEA